MRVDSDTIDKLIHKDEERHSKLNESQKEDLKSVFNIRVKSKEMYHVVTEALDENDAPVTITQSEFMRRMKDMSAVGGGMNFYGELPDSYNLVVNTNHKLIGKISDDLAHDKQNELEKSSGAIAELREQIDFIEKEHKDKKSEEISQTEKDDLDKLCDELRNAENARHEVLEAYGADNKIVKQLIDLALLSNNLLRGEELNTFVRRSVDLL